MNTPRFVKKSFTIQQASFGMRSASKEHSFSFEVPDLADEPALMIICFPGIKKKVKDFNPRRALKRMEKNRTLWSCEIMCI